VEILKVSEPAVRITARASADVSEKVVGGVVAWSGHHRLLIAPAAADADSMLPRSHGSGVVRVFAAVVVVADVMTGPRGW
jgi:hypothetical protein